MLKITEINNNSEITSLKFEGKIIKEWADLLKQECENHLSAHKSLKLDLSEVSFIDSYGTQILKELKGKKVELCNCSMFLKQLLKCNEDKNGCCQISH